MESYPKVRGNRYCCLPPRNQAGDRKLAQSRPTVVLVPLDLLGSTIAGIEKEVAMFEPPYRALRILLGVFSLLAALGGLLMIFADKPLIVRILLRPPEGEWSTLAASLLKEMGGMVLTLAVFLWLAPRDPMKNVAIVDGLIAGLCVLAVTPLVSLWMTDIRSLYPAYLLWGRSVLRIAIAALLYWMRPREKHWEPAGNF